MTRHPFTTSPATTPGLDPERQRRVLPQLIAFQPNRDRKEAGNVLAFHPNRARQQADSQSAFLHGVNQ